MANRNNNVSQQDDATPFVKHASCHTYDNWLVPAARHADAVFASKVLDVARGAKTIASIMASHLIDLNAIIGGASDTRTLLSENDTEALARLAVFALDELHSIATNRVDLLNTQAEKGARA